MARLGPTAPTSWWSRSRSESAYPLAHHRPSTPPRRGPCVASALHPGRPAIGPAPYRPSEDPARPDPGGASGSRRQSARASTTNHRADEAREDDGATDEHAGEDHEERRIAHGLVDGDRQALADAFARWGEMIHALCSRWADADAADDLTQQVFVAAWQSRGSFDPTRGVVPAWLVGIARNTTNRSFRGIREIPTDPSHAPHDRAVDDPADALADEVLVAQAFRELPEAQRLSLELSYWEGMTQSEVATRLDLPLGTVKSHQRRGLQRLRHLLEVSHDQR